MITWVSILKPPILIQAQPMIICTNTLYICIDNHSHIHRLKAQLLFLKPPTFRLNLWLYLQVHLSYKFFTSLISDYIFAWYFKTWPSTANHHSIEVHSASIGLKLEKSILHLLARESKSSSRLTCTTEGSNDTNIDFWSCCWRSLIFERSSWVVGTDRWITSHNRWEVFSCRGNVWTTKVIQIDQ